MRNYLMRWLGFNLIILLCFIIMVKSSTTTTHRSQNFEKLSKIVKRELSQKAREYLKEKPLSAAMKSFIRRYKRRPKSIIPRSKREPVDKEHMYVVKDGDIIPFGNMTSVATQDEQPVGNFTVIPLIIPITVRNYGNISDMYTSPEDTEDIDELSTELSIKGHCPLSTGTTVRKRAKLATKPIHKESAALSATTAVAFAADEEDEDDMTKSPSAESPSKEERVIDDAVLRTQKPDDEKFLEKVLDDVEDLIKYEKEGKSYSNEGAQCNVVGDWDSDAGGVQFRIKRTNDSNHAPSIKIVQQEPRMEGGFLCDGNWTISAQMPFNHSSLIILTAMTQRKVAIFIGECRICQGSETISGNWMLGRRSRNCKDREESHTILTDVMRKNNVRKLQKAHLELINATASTSTTVIP